ncbi:MAG TPA: stage V sporulation protein AB [Clostridiales bacterium]|nr:stage V sporulation protein AB [Clostridiales bacterium]
MSNQIYLQLKDGVLTAPGRDLFIKDLAVLLADKPLREKISNIKVISISDDASDHVVVSMLTVMKKIKEKYPEVELFPIGEAEILVKVQKSGKEPNKIFLLLKLSLVCLILFVGAGLALMNFHADVNMIETHQKIYKMITGIEEKKPLFLQIPYSIGIALGMAVFFNHILPKKIKNEPSPLEVEMFSYRKNIDEYLLKNETNTEENNR